MNSTYTGNQASDVFGPLTIEVLREALRKMPKSPFEELANKHGFSLNAGDMMILPESIKADFKGLLHKQVHFSRFVNIGYLLKKRKALI